MPEDQAKKDKEESTPTGNQPSGDQPTQAKLPVIPPPEEELHLTLVQTAGSAILTAHELPFGTQIGSAATYRVLPARLADSALGRAVAWRVELHGLTVDEGPLGLDLVGDVILGRGNVAGEMPDLDLDPYGAFEMGVSRQHALLRPSRTSLYLIDLNSTNGTWHNALRLGSGLTRALSSDDTITLGKLTFTIRIISGSMNAASPPKPAE